MIARSLAGAMAFVACTGPAYAELPQPVATMLDDAIANGTEAEVDAVAKYARKALPGQEAEIDERLSGYRARLATAAAAASAAAAETGKAESGGGFFAHWTGQGELG